jgi:hypothetical protein
LTEACYERSILVSKTTKYNDVVQVVAAAVPIVSSARKDGVDTVATGQSRAPLFYSTRALVERDSCVLPATSSERQVYVQRKKTRGLEHSHHCPRSHHPCVAPLSARFVGVLRNEPSVPPSPSSVTLPALYTIKQHFITPTTLVLRSTHAVDNVFDRSRRRRPPCESIACIFAVHHFHLAKTSFA